MARTSFLGELGELAGDALGAGELTVAVKTNLGPEFRVGEGGGFARALGIRAAVIVRDRDGRALFHYGEPPATNYALTALLLAAGVLVSFALVRGLVKR